MSLPHDPHPFDDLVRGQSGAIRLADAALQFARDEYPSLKPIHYLERLDALASRVDASCEGRSAADRVDALRRVLVEEAGLSGNRDDYADPANSYLNRVLDTRCGIPISMSVVWLDVAERLDWPLAGVSMPGHFIVAYDAPEGRTLLDPFNSGQELSFEDCRRIVAILFQNTVELTEQHLEPAGTLAILERMLGNLYATYARAGDWLRTVRVLRRMIALRPESLALHQELGRVLMLLGKLDDAAAVLTQAHCLAIAPDEISAVDHFLAELRRLRVRAN